MQMIVCIRNFRNSCYVYASEIFPSTHAFSLIYILWYISQVGIKNYISFHCFQPYLVSSEDIKIFMFLIFTQVLSMYNIIKSRMSKSSNYTHYDPIIKCSCGRATGSRNIPAVMYTICIGCPIWSWSIW